MTANADSAPASPEALDPELEAEVLGRLREALRARGATRDLRKMPQAMLPLDAAEVEAIEYFPWKRMIGSKEALPLKELLDAPANAFVSRCYRLLVGREPTLPEAKRARALGSKKLARLLFVSSLRWAGQGRSAKVPLTDVVPPLGKVFASAVELASKPFSKRK